MDRIIKANIQRFKKLLETEQDPTKRAMIERLLREELEKRNARRRIRPTTRPRRRGPIRFGDADAAPAHGALDWSAGLVLAVRRVEPCPPMGGLDIDCFLRIPRQPPPADLLAGKDQHAGLLPSITHNSSLARRCDRDGKPGVVGPGRGFMVAG